jgi:hypothetical protein
MKMLGICLMLPANPSQWSRHFYTVAMRRLSRPHPSPLYAGFVPIEMAASASFLFRNNSGGGGQIVFLTFTTINEVAVCEK